MVFEINARVIVPGMFHRDLQRYAKLVEKSSEIM